jgi:hypothetical protein
MFLADSDPDKLPGRGIVLLVGSIGVGMNHDNFRPQGTVDGLRAYVRAPAAVSDDFTSGAVGDGEKEGDVKI